MAASPVFKILYAIAFAWQLGFLIAFPILGFGLLGRFLGDLVGLRNLLTLVGLILGVGIAIYETINMISPMVKKNG